MCAAHHRWPAQRSYNCRLALQRMQETAGVSRNMTNQAANQAARSGHSLAEVDPFSCLPGDVLSDLDTQCSWTRVPADNLVIDGTQKTAHGVFALMEGEVEVQGRDSNSRIIPLGRLSAKTCFGEFAAIHGQTGSVSVRTSTPSLLGEISADAFVGLLNDYPALSLVLLRRAVSLVRALDDDLVKLRSVEHEFGDFRRQAVVWCL